MTKVIKFKNNNYLYGTLIEIGTNENGTYEKYSDGRLIQYGSSSFGNSGTVADSYKTITFPISFFSNYIIFANEIYGGDMNNVHLIPTRSEAWNKSSNSIYRRYTYLSSNDSGQTSLYSKITYFYWIAYGYWK